MRSIFSKLTVGIFLCLLSFAAAQCSVDTSAFQGGLIVVAEDMDGFATRLGMPEDPEKLPYVVLDCEAGTQVSIAISKPVHVKEGGPELSGPLESYFYYQGEVYSSEKTLKLTGSFENLRIPVRMLLRNSKNNQDEILLASTNYRYTVSLIITTVAAEPEVGAEAVNSDVLERAVSSIFQLDSKLFQNQEDK